VGFSGEKGKEQLFWFKGLDKIETLRGKDRDF
jgi:hypothetical protein